MNLRILTDKELESVAYRDPRYGTDPLFTELVWRLGNPPDLADECRDEPLLTDARD